MRYHAREAILLVDWQRRCDEGHVGDNHGAPVLLEHCLHAGGWLGRRWLLRLISGVICQPGFVGGSVCAVLYSVLRTPYSILSTVQYVRMR